jgi:hypothetical protein
LHLILEHVYTYVGVFGGALMVWRWKYLLGTSDNIVRSREDKGMRWILEALKAFTTVSCYYTTRRTAKHT